MRALSSVTLVTVGPAQVPVDARASEPEVVDVLPLNEVLGCSGCNIASD